MIKRGYVGPNDQEAYEDNKRDVQDVDMFKRGVCMNIYMIERTARGTG